MTYNPQYPETFVIEMGGRPFRKTLEKELRSRDLLNKKLLYGAIDGETVEEAVKYIRPLAGDLPRKIFATTHTRLEPHNTTGTGLAELARFYNTFGIAILEKSHFVQHPHGNEDEWICTQTDDFESTIRGVVRIVL